MICEYDGGDGRVTCMVPAVRDKYCTAHWRLVYGHLLSTVGQAEDAGREVPPYCAHCQRLLNFDGWEDHHCPGRGFGAHGSEARVLAMGHLARMMEAFGLPHINLEKDKDAAQGFLFVILDMLPQCPDCHTKRCADWAYRYLFWVANTVMDKEHGALSMFLTIVQLNGGEMTFHKEELAKTREQVRYLQRSVCPTGDHITVKAVTVEEDEGREHQAHGEEEWPDLINPDAPAS